MAGIRWLACLACLASCVPRGDPPAGRQLIADRTTALVGIVRPNGDGTTRVLVTRPGQDPMTVDLSVIAADAAGGPPSERVLAAGLQSTSFSVDCQLRANCFPSDAQGRVFLTTGYDMTAFGPVPITTRIDPVTGDRLELGDNVVFILSPSGQRLLVFTPVSDAAARMYANLTLYEADDRAVSLGATNFGSFIGEDLYYLTTQQEVMRLVPGGVPELLATGVSFFSPLTLEGDLLLELVRPSADPLVNAFSIFDAVTLEETASPFGSTPFEMSADGRWLLAFDSTAGSATFVERTTGAKEVFTPPDYPIGGYAWRPGHDEVWFMNSDYLNPTTWIKKPGEAAVEIPRVPFPYTTDAGQGSYFTSGGAYWFSSRAPVSDKPIIQVGSADDPAGARFDVMPAGATSDAYWQLADGRILAPSWFKDPKRNDIYVVDPVTGEMRLLGEEGLVIVVGQTRLVASQHVIDGRGDLTAIDLGSGQATVLAPEFALGALVEPQGADRVAPGAHVAFQFQARFASPYDGIWLATIP